MRRCRIALTAALIAAAVGPIAASRAAHACSCRGLIRPENALGAAELAIIGTPLERLPAYRWTVRVHEWIKGGGPSDVTVDGGACEGPLTAGHTAGILGEWVGSEFRIGFCGSILPLEKLRDAPRAAPPLSRGPPVLLVAGQFHAASVVGLDRDLKPVRYGYERGVPIALDVCPGSRVAVEVIYKSLRIRDLDSFKVTHSVPIDALFDSQTGLLTSRVRCIDQEAQRVLIETGLISYRGLGSRRVHTVRQGLLDTSSVVHSSFAIPVGLNTLYTNPDGNTILRANAASGETVELLRAPDGLAFYDGVLDASGRFVALSLGSPEPNRLGFSASTFGVLDLRDNSLRTGDPRHESISLGGWSADGEILVHVRGDSPVIERRGVDAQVRSAEPASWPAFSTRSVVLADDTFVLTFDASAQARVERRGSTLQPFTGFEPAFPNGELVTVPLRFPPNLDASVATTTVPATLESATQTLASTPAASASRSSTPWLAITGVIGIVLAAVAAMRAPCLRALCRRPRPR